MANLQENPNWAEGIYQLEKTDPVVGGADGIANRQAKQLADRTAYLKQQLESDKLKLQNLEQDYAPKHSPELTGVPTAPTASQDTNNTQVANTSFVKTAISNLVGSAPASLNTLAELATALGEDGNLKETLLNLISQKVSKSGDTMTGDLFINISKVLTEDDFQVKALTSENFNDIWKVGIY
ncbi:hypothetical protein QJU58_10205, partial [Pasteurella atlantica]|nr:hypothetical protein [Pasteurella atlantica]MDP8046801.1 hypothetical protein [Pasteurella atlantica]MDP8090327.1 hypothetical protein [Pasteurella atlantica]MDP8123629.1 hypothetical protein [Pasteurella atlantica]MDP8135477.1 hypothetical protein [Pasteurella atlantica]